MPVVKTNVRVEAGDDGRTPGPDWRKCTAYRQTGPGGLPLGLASTEGLGLTAAPVAQRPQCKGNVFRGTNQNTLKPCIYCRLDVFGQIVKEDY